MIYAKGNILHTSAQVIICTVNMKGAMGAGLAKECADIYPGLLEKYRRMLKGGFLKLGEPCLVKDNSWEHDILLFATKDHWKEPSQLEWITDGLDNLIERCEITGYTANCIAIPRLGCGLGKLKWDTVKPEIISRVESLEKIFKEVYLYG